MVHPTELLRTNSAGEGSFVAPVGDYRNDVDCGCQALPCLNERLNLEKYAKPGVFVGVLSAVAFLHGTIVKYFRGTSQLWSNHYGIQQNTIDWLVYTNEVFVGIFALVVTYWGNRLHRPKTLGALTMYLAVSCIMLAVPEIYQPYSRNETDISNINGGILCQIPTLGQLQKLPLTAIDAFQEIPFAILILYQIIYALCSVSLICHGVTYIDDNISPKHSPGYIALIFAAQRVGKQVGIYSSWTPYVLKTQSIFVSPVWLIIATLTFLVGFLIAMFPKIMPNILLRKSVISLLSIAAGNAVVEDQKSVDGFFKSLWRIIQNKILLINILSIVMMQAALINFSILEKFFNQSKYHVSKYNDASGYSDPALIQFTTNLLKQPLVAISIVTSGMLIAKVRPKAKYLVIWNITVFVLIALGFAGIRFWNCTNRLKNELRDKLMIPYCSWNCGCSLDGPFQPVCLNADTYFSPCIAGCSSYDSTFRMYQNCSCGTSERTNAAEGSCDLESCSVLWALAQVNSVISSGLLATTVVSVILINIRSVSSKDKALAMGLHLTFLGLIPYLPIRASYDAISDKFCQLWGKSGCQFYSDNFTVFLSSATIVLMTLAVILAVVLLFLVEKLPLYTNNTSRRGSDIDTSVLRRNADTQRHVNGNYNNANNSSNNNDPSNSTPNLETTALIHNPNEILLKNKQQSDSKLNTIASRSSRDDRISAYLSEGDLVPPLKSNLKLGKSTSRTSNSNTSALSTDSSLFGIANTVGDDHDSDISSLPRTSRLAARPPAQLSAPSQNKIIETEF